MKFLGAILMLLAVVGAASSSVGISGASFTSASANPRNTFTAAADWTGPAVSVANPGSPLHGTVTVNATAADAIGTVSSVRIQRAVAGSGQWVDICTTATSPYSCSWNTTSGADGGWDLRAIATDNSSNSTTSAVVSARVVDNTAPVVAIADPGSYVKGTITVQASASDATTGVTSVALQRSPSGAGTWTTICTVTAAPYSCSLNTKAGLTPDGAYDFRAVATDGVGNTSSDLIDAYIDNTAPSVSVTVPGSPLRGVVTLSTSPADTGSGVSDVMVQVSAAGTGNWVTACTSSASPWSCTWDSSSVAGGSYDFRAIVNDLAGNSGSSTTVTRTVDNSVSSVFMTDPGAYIHGTVTLQATVSSPATSPSVKIQISPTGANTWTTICTVTASPWSCPLDTTTKLDGVYDFRAVLTDSSGTKTSNVASSRIDNTLLRGQDVQSANKTGGTIGHFEAGDTMTLTYSELVAPTSLSSGWDGSTPLNVYIRLRDGGLLTPKLSGKNDTIDLFTDSGLKTAVNIGSVNTKTDLIAGGKVAVFTGTLTRSGSTATALTLTVGTLVSGSGIRTASDKVLMIWTPSATATDLAGNACSTAPVTESGTGHLNF